MPRSTLSVDGRQITVTNLDKVLYPETGTRKFDVLTYIIGIADAMLPHLASRPITRKRWPHGTGSTFFFEKALAPGTPDWLARFSITGSERTITYPVAQTAADLVWLTTMAALELHVPQWRIDLSGVGSAGDESRRTDRLIIDLDPGPGVSLRHCADVALEIRTVLTAAGLTPFPVTSGGKGIHIYARFPKPVSSESARTVARELAVALAAAHPKDITATMSAAARESKVFLDWSQNTAAKTTLAPYSLRGNDRPHVAAPRTWAELSEPDLAQLDYQEVLDRFTADGDLLAELDPPVTVPAEVVDLGTFRRTAAHRKSRTTGTTSGEFAGPDAPRPMLASDGTIDHLTDQSWAFEGKWDGYRMLAHHRAGIVRLMSRGGIDMTDDFPAIAELGAVLRGFDVVLDGEMVAYDSIGRTNFTLLTARDRRGAEITSLAYLVFDILELNGTDLRSAPWEQRRAVLDELTPVIESASIAKVPALLPGPGSSAVNHAKRQGWEGVIAKRRAASYQAGRRSTDWRKHKNWNDIEVVIGGFRAGRGSRSGSIGSLLVGLPVDGGLRYIGRVGTGFTDADLEALAAELRSTTISRSPFVGGIDRPVASSATWVRPSLVADVRFLDWTSTGHLRHPSWRGIRRDKLPGDL